MLNFYKMLKYAKENPTNPFSLHFKSKYRLDLIEVPEEYKDITTDGMVIKRGAKSRRI